MRTAARAQHKQIKEFYCTLHHVARTAHAACALQIDTNRKSDL